MPRMSARRSRAAFVSAVLLLFAAEALAATREITLSAPRGLIRIAVTGDTGDGSATVAKGIAALHAKRPLDAIILTGDNFYPCAPPAVDDPAWNRAVKPLTAIGVPVLPVLGNHDYCGHAVPAAQLRASAVIPHWMFPAREYAVRTPFADFVMLDTTPYVNGHAATTTIADVLHTSAKPWQIVVGHHTMVSSGWHGYFPRADVARMRELAPAMHREGVDLYICGHDHHVELIRGTMRYLISGAGSDPIPPIRLHTRTLFPSEIARERIGFAVIEISAQELAVRFYDARGEARSERFTQQVQPRAGTRRR
jgi:acid phosphatase